MMNPQTHIYKHKKSQVIIKQCVSVTPVTIIRVSYNNNTIDIQIIVEICMKKATDVTPEFL